MTSEQRRDRADREFRQYRDDDRRGGYHARQGDRRYTYRSKRQIEESQRGSRSPSPDPALVKFLAEQARPLSPDSEAYRKQRLAAAGVSNVKSKHQKEKEDAERRKKDAEEDAAKAYEEFIEHMKGEESSKKRKTMEATGFVRAGAGEAYQSSGRFLSVDDSNQPSASALEERISSIDEAQRTRATQYGKGGAMKDFLGELQHNQAMREERLKDRVSDKRSVSSLLALESQRGGIRDSNDADSANLCVLNLPSHTSESSLAMYFSAHGDVASVKIMWPRNEDVYFDKRPNGVSERCTRHDGATGFVNFMKRSDAQVAYREVDGSTWNGCILRTSWSKSVAQSSTPICRKSDVLVTTTHEHPKDSQMLNSKSRKELANVGAFCDTGEKSAYDSDCYDRHDDASATPDGDRSSAIVAERIDRMLRGLTLRRERIAYVMHFAIKNTSNADLITDRLIQSLLQAFTPLPRKLARLYAVSDILHNSGATAHGAWRYRSLLASRLDSVFLHWGDVANSFTGRMKREGCKDSVRALLGVWEGWMVFESGSIARWRALLENGSRKDFHPTMPQESTAESQSPSVEHLDDEEDIDGEEMPFEEAGSNDPKPTAIVAEDDIDGEEM